MSGARRHAILFVSFLGAYSSVASAEPSAADKETARHLMAEGREKRDANDLKGALQSFMAADALMHVPTTALEVARTLVSLGQLIEAREGVLHIVRSPPEKDEPPPFTRAREEARELNDDLMRRIPTLTIKLAGVDASLTNVTVDGASIPSASLGVPRTLDPGRHVVIAAAAAKQTRAEVDVVESQHREIVLDLKEPVSAPVALAAPPVAESPAAPARSEGGIGRPLMIGGIVVGGIGVVVGSIAGVLSITKTNSVKSQCADNFCPAVQESELESARSMATIANIGFAVGAAGLVVGVVGYFLQRGGNADVKAGGPRGAARARLELDVSPLGTAGALAGVRGAF